ncbi:hypothetical protein EON65_15180 [archaeon]|nr:MAG: hypothetical protein EON65_15180 [archaeon]
MLSSKSITNIIDVGAYYNPIHLFLGQGVCPENVLIVEPILDALSVQIPCQSSPDNKKATHVIFLPITFKYYMTIKDTLPRIETVVCIGCDSHYGPSRYMLETAFRRPYTLYLEYPHDYIHNAPYRKMQGNGPGEQLLFMSRFQAKTNETIYTKRVMKVIDYKQL